MKRLLVVLLAVIVVASLLLGCGSESTTTSAPTSSTTKTTTAAPTTTAATQPTTTTAPSTTVNKYGGTLRIILIAGPQNAGGIPSEVFGPDATSYQFVMEPFLKADNKGTYIPWLAESYTQSTDLLSVTCVLRKGVKFHDGTDLNAKVAKWNIDNYIKSPNNQYWASCDVIDDYTVKVTFKSWINTIMGGFTSTSTWMSSQAAFEKNGADVTRNNPVGTGPFVFKSFQRDVAYKVARNPNYWQTGKPYLDAVEVQYVPDQMTQKAAIESGQADMLQIEPSKAAKELETAGFKTVFNPITVYSLFPDTAHPDSPYANQKVREAVEYALDRDGMATAFSFGYWKTVNQLIYPGNAAYNPNFTLARKYDPAKAKALLAEAGLKDGFNTTILVNPSIVNRDIGVALQTNLAAVNIKAELNFPANMGKFIADSNSLINVLVIQPVMGSSNWNGSWMFFDGPKAMWNKNFGPSAEFLKLKDASLAAPKADVALIQAAADQLIKEAAAIPFMLAGLGWVTRTGINDIGFGETSSTDILRSESAWLTKK